MKQTQGLAALGKCSQGLSAGTGAKDSGNGEVACSEQLTWVQVEEQRELTQVIQQNTNNTGQQNEDRKM